MPPTFFVAFKDDCWLLSSPVFRLRSIILVMTLALIAARWSADFIQFATLNDISGDNLETTECIVEEVEEKEEGEAISSSEVGPAHEVDRLYAETAPTRDGFFENVLPPPRFS